MATFLLRVGLPDRPGALGAVASRIGAVRADVVAVDIVGRGEGRAVDEFVVELADEGHVSLLLSEVAEVDGVEVEEVRVLPPVVADRNLDPYETAVSIVSERTPHGVLGAVASRARHELSARWSAILDVEDRILVASSGDPPAGPWLSAYVVGTRWHAPGADKIGGSRLISDEEDETPGAHGHAPAADVAWVDLAVWDLVMAVGRPGWPIGDADRRRLAAIGRLADARWTDLAEGDSRASHPSSPGRSPTAPAAPTTPTARPDRAV
ncbi:MAG TPA: ACT domain-containing protein [Acidimicrobiales bacterium]|nr:ACT domain-containing protein [Acidimicrobiales bacterium]